MAGKNHSGRPWTIREFSGFGTATDTNQRFKYIPAQGQPGLSVAFDVPTLMGYDSDHSLSEGEVGVCGVAVDPLGGSYYIESLTDRLESGAEAYFEQIHAYGGMVETIEAGYPQREIMTAEARYQEALENGQKIIVGVNDYVDPNEPDIETLHIDPRIETRQKIRLQSIRSRRNSREVIRTLDHLKKTIQAGRNIMPPLLEAVQAYATLEGRSWLYYRKYTVYMMNQRYFS